MREINILGITLKDYSLREELKLTEKYINNGALNTVVYISAKQLILASEDEVQGKRLEKMDLLIPGDVDLLKATNAAFGRNRMKEVENNDYLREFLKKTARAKYPVYLLTYSTEQLERFKGLLLKRQSNLYIVGEGTMEPLQEAENWQDRLVNEINDIAPKIILSKMSFEQYTDFVEKNRMKINSDIILGLPEKRILEEKTSGVVRLTKFIYNKMLHRKVMKYKKDKAE